MNEDLDIYVQVRFAGDRGVSYMTLDRTLTVIAEVVERVELEEFEAIVGWLRGQQPNSASDWPSVLVDAMRWRLRQIDRRELLTVEEARTGSLFIVASCSALAYWVLDKTLGETVKEAWKGSDFDQQLQAFLRKRVFHKRRRMTRYLQQRFAMDKKVDTVNQGDGLRRTVIHIAQNVSEPAIPKASDVHAERHQGEV